MIIAQNIFWVCLLLVVYTYLLYPVLLFAAYATIQVWRDLQYVCGRWERRTSPNALPQLPSVSLLIAAYNEERDLPRKLQNIREMDYAAHRVQVIFVSDGSTDATNDILRNAQDTNIEVVILPKRYGKANALNEAVERSCHPILVFTDVSTLFDADALAKLVRHFKDPRVGAVCGTVRLNGSEESARTEGVYWKYDSAIRLMEGRLGATVVATGAIHALRRNCFRPLQSCTIVDDLLIPMNARRSRLDVVHDPEASATEFSAASVSNEFTRRVRLAVGSFRAFSDVVRIPIGLMTLWALLSHKFLRWIVPFNLLGVLAATLALARHPFFRIALVAQVLFYFWAFMGYAFRTSFQKIRFALMGYFLVAMHLAFLVGFWRFLFDERKGAWEKVAS